MDAMLLPAIEAEDAHKIDRKSVRRLRVELITRGERRRRCSIEQKREIVAENLGPDTTPTEVARRHAISSGLLYTWRQQLLGVQIGPSARSAPSFAQVEITGASPRLEARDRMPIELAGSSTASLPRIAGVIEIALSEGVTLRVDAQVNGRALRRVLGALVGWLGDDRACIGSVRLPCVRGHRYAGAADTDGGSVHMCRARLCGGVAVERLIPGLCTGSAAT